MPYFAVQNMTFDSGSPARTRTGMAISRIFTPPTVTSRQL
jgi:hypothetical protein